LGRYDEKYKTIYVIGPPGCYLCSKLKPLDPLLFHSSYKDSLELIRPYWQKFYDDHGYPDVLLLFNGDSFGKPTTLDQEILEHHYSLALNRANYRIFVAKDTTPDLEQKTGTAVRVK
jgi:hypothetical protein